MHSTITKHRNLSIFIIIAFFFTVTSLSTRAATAQQSPLDWAPAKLITTRQESASEPELYADPSGLIHLFWSPYANEQQALYYSRWIGSYWTEPVDIFYGLQIRGPQAVVSPNGLIHLIWGDGTSIYYAQASVSKALSARHWSPPLPIANGNPHANLLVDSQGVLYAVYPGLSSSGPKLTISEDSGNTWSEEIQISFTSSPDVSADFVNGAISRDGTLHVVWTEYQLPQGWPPAGLYYSRSKDRGNTWSRPFLLAGEGYNQVNIAAADNGQVHVAWNGMAGVGGRYHRWSSDGGNTWSSINTVIPAGFGGSEGSPPLAIDSLGTVHMLTTYDQRVWYISFPGSGGNRRWSTPQYIPTGAETGIPPLPQPVAESVRHIEYPALTLNLGNTLHAVFWDERPADQIIQYWYTSKQTSAPALDPIPFPAPAPIPVSEPENSPPQAIQDSEASQPQPTLSPELVYSKSSLTDTGLPILIALLPVTLILLAVFFIKRRIWR